MAITKMEDTAKTYLDMKHRDEVATVPAHLRAERAANNQRTDSDIDHPRIEQERRQQTKIPDLRFAWRPSHGSQLSGVDLLRRNYVHEDSKILKIPAPAQDNVTSATMGVLEKPRFTSSVHFVTTGVGSKRESLHEREVSLNYMVHDTVVNDDISEIKAATSDSRLSDTNFRNRIVDSSMPDLS